MTKQHLFIFLMLAGILFTGCNNDDMSVPDPTAETTRILKIRASMPVDDEAGTRVTASQKANSKDIELRWEADDKIQLYFKQGDALIKGSEVTVQHISADGKHAEFDITIPDEINTENPFSIYGVHGVQSVISEGAILLDARPFLYFRPMEDIPVPVYFKAENLTSVDGINVVFRHYGALQVLTFKNASSTKIEMLMAAAPLSDESEGFGEFGYYSLDSDDGKPVYDIISGGTSFREIEFDETGLPPDLSDFISVAATANVKLAQWMVPNGNIPDALTLGMTPDFEISILSKHTKPKRTAPLQVGHAYHLYAVWDGTDLDFADEAATVSHSITFTTTKKVNEDVDLFINAPKDDRTDVWIDLNNNGNKDSEETVTDFAKTIKYYIGAQTVTLYGNVTDFYCNNDNITSIYIANTVLTSLYCYYNQITTLNFGNNTALKSINCGGNQLTVLDVTKLTALRDLYCDTNLLTMLDVANNTALTALFCYQNRLKALDVNSNTALTTLRCQENQLETLDVSRNMQLTQLWCHGNRIKKQEEMDMLVNSLPDRTGKTPVGEFRVILPWVTLLDNVCTKAQVEAAKSKNWNVKNSGGIDYEGS